MQITNELLQDLNLFRNGLILRIEELEDKINWKILLDLKQAYINLEIELMAKIIDNNKVKEACENIASLCFLINQKLEK